MLENLTREDFTRYRGSETEITGFAHSKRELTGREDIQLMPFQQQTDTVTWIPP